jgi:hypothetical protein
MMFEVNEQEPDIMDVLLPLSQKRIKEPYVLTANNQNLSSKQHLKQYLSDKEEQRRKRGIEKCKASRSTMSVRIHLLKKHVPGASQLTQPEVVIAAVNYITFLEQTIQKMKEKTLRHRCPPQTHKWP